MRPFVIRVVRPLFLSLVILSCATESAVGPTLKPADARVSFAVLSSTSTVVISQVYGGGGNSGATIRNDFIELFNRGSDAASVEGWSVQYASSAGATWQKTNLAGSIPAGGYLLVQEAQGTGGTVSLPTPDATGTIAMSATSGKVALVRNTTALACGTASTCAASEATIADLVGFGSSASFFEGAGPTATLSNTKAAIRNDAGCGDTDDNAADFVSDVPSPRNSQTAPAPCAPVGPAGPVATVSVSPAASTIFLGSTRQFSAVGTDENGHSSPTTFTWISSDPTILAFADPANGLASTPGGLGAVTITATAENGVAGTTTALVTEPGVSSVSISINDPRQAPAGYTKPAFPTVRDANGAAINPIPTLVWSSSNTDIATVDGLGYITGVSPGTVTIKATASNGAFGTNSFTVIPATAPTSANYGHALEFGTPTDNSPADDFILTKPQYSESYNKNRGGPNWVSWDLNASQFGAAPRCDCFSADQTLPADFYHVVDFDYRNGGYDRGHMVQSESRTTTDQENASTFLLTNILPQGGNNNQGPWSRFENYLNDLARGTVANPTRHEIYVIAGGAYGPNPGTLKGEGKVAIPDYTWKIAVIMDAGEGLADVHSASDLEIIVVEMPNLVGTTGPASSDPIRNVPWEQFVKTVDAIEAETGYDFLSNLPNGIEAALESGDRPPVAALSGPSLGTEGAELDFNGGNSSDPDQDALTYLWDFGDGTTETSAAPAHTYADNGAYTVTLTVKDPAGADDSRSQLVTISNATPVVKSLTTTSTLLSGETVFAMATFGDAGTRDNPWTYLFDWGEGSTSDGSTADQNSAVGSSRSFLAAGTYSVAFTVTDKDGATSTRRVATFAVERIPTALTVNPGRINIKGKGNGQVIVTVLGTRTFAAASINLGTVRIGTVGIDTKGNDGFKSSVKDDNKDGIPDLVVHFDRSALIGDGQLTSSTTQLVLHADLSDGRQIEARGPVNVGKTD